MAAAVASRGVAPYYASKIDELEALLRDKTQNLRRLEAQRNELNSKGGTPPNSRVCARERHRHGPVSRAVRTLREELVLLHEPGSHVGEVVKQMGKDKVGG